MNYKELFKQYNLKVLKKNFWLLFLMSLSILITVTVSLIIPQISYQQQNYTKSKIREINGADLKITTSYMSPDFDKKLTELEAEGLKIDSYKVSMIYINHDKNSILSQMIIGNYNLLSNEVILSASIANSLNAKVGDKIRFDKSSGLNKEYIVKVVDDYNRGVTSQAEFIGYIKLNDLEESIVSNQKIVLINGRDGEELKRELVKIEDGYEYSSLIDQEKNLMDKLNVQMMALNILNTMGYILTIALIISSILMIINKSKVDIAILRLIAIDYRVINKAMKLQLFLFMIIPLLLAGAISPLVANIFLAMQKIDAAGIDFYIISSIIKCLVFNGIILYILTSIALKVLQAIKPLDIVKEDESALRKLKMQIGLKITIAVPIILFVYSIISGNSVIFNSSIAIFVFVLFILFATMALLKVVLKLPISNMGIRYALKSITKTKMIYLVALVNTTIVLWCILIGFNLGNVLKESIDKGINSSLPYNYMIKADNSDYIVNYLNSNKERIEGYNLISYSPGKVIDKEISDKVVLITEIMVSDYKLKFKVIAGEDLVNTDTNAVLVSNKYCDNNNLYIGDKIKVMNEKGEAEYTIKGIYDCSSVNQNWILKASENQFTNQTFLVKVKDDTFFNNLENCYIANMNIVGDALLTQMDKFLIMFKYLCLLYVVSAILFNFNMNYMYYQSEERNYTIIRAIGYNRSFSVRDQIFKAILNVILSTFMSLGIYALLLKFALTLMFNISSSIESDGMILVISSAIVITGASLIPIFKQIFTDNNFDLLREKV